MHVEKHKLRFGKKKKKQTNTYTENQGLLEIEWIEFRCVVVAVNSIESLVQKRKG